MDKSSLVAMKRKLQKVSFKQSTSLCVEITRLRERESEINEVPEDHDHLKIKIIAEIHN